MLHIKRHNTTESKKYVLLKDETAAIPQHVLRIIIFHMFFFMFPNQIRQKKAETKTYKSTESNAHNKTKSIKYFSYSDIVVVVGFGCNQRCVIITSTFDEKKGKNRKLTEKE